MLKDMVEMIFNTKVYSQTINHVWGQTEKAQICKDWDFTAHSPLLGKLLAKFEG